MLDALEPCCAQAPVKLKSEIAANSTFPMLPPPRSRRPQCYRAACRLRGAVRWLHSVESEMIRTLIALAAAAILGLPMATSAADDTRADKNAGAGASRDARFDELDKNRDGFISRDEGKDAEELQTRFSELDTNNDNKLSRDEYKVLKQDARGAAGGTRPATK